MASSRLALDCLTGPDEKGYFHFEKNDNKQNPLGSSFETFHHVFCNITEVPLSVLVFTDAQGKQFDRDVFPAAGSGGPAGSGQAAQEARQGADSVLRTPNEKKHMNNHRAFPACALLLAWALSLSGVAFADPPATSPDAKAAWYNLLPNGSFEHWSHFGAEVLARQLKAGTVYDSDDPLVPTCWNFETSSGTSLKRSQDAHSGKHAISIGAGKNGSARLGLGRLEVIPGAEYTFGVWVKGTGKVSVSLQGQAFEGNQELGALNAQAGDKYALVEGKAVIPRHIRFVALELVAWGDMLLDDAHVSARLDQPYDADAVLAKKYARDSHTLVMADFEKDDPGIILETKAHVIKEGKFGKALRIDPPDTASIPFKVEKMPQEGTFEFWLSPDEIPIFQPNRKDTIKTYLVVRSGAADLAHISSDTSGCLRWSWRTGEDTWHWQNSVAANCLGRMRKGQWTHVAVTWDKEAWRMYVDGVLADVQTDPPLNWFAAPVNIGISVDYAHGQWKGAIAEIRVSDIKRYGPIVPTGATVPPMIKAAPAVVVEPPKPAKPKTDFAPSGPKLIGALPPTGAAPRTSPTPQGITSTKPPRSSRWSPARRWICTRTSPRPA